MTAWAWLVRVRGLARRAVELARVVVAEPWWWLSRSGRLWWHHKVTATLYPLATATLWHFGVQLGAVLSMVPVLAVAGWARLGPISYDRRVRLPLLRRRVRREVIELWPGLMESVGLARRTPIATRRSGDQVTPADRVELPVLARLGWQDDWTLVGWPRLLLGQTVEDVEAVVDRLRVGVRAYRCRVVANPSLTACTIVWSFDDSLARPFEAQVPAADAPVSDLRWLPMGRTEDGGMWWLPFGRSTMTAGCSGAGKASLLWGLLFALGPAIRTGLVVVLGIDLKGGMELSMGAPMFTRYACRVEAAVVMLEDAVRDLQARAERLAGITRQHTPSVEDPLVVVVVDELAVLIAYAPDPKLVARAEAALVDVVVAGSGGRLRGDRVRAGPAQGNGADAAPVHPGDRAAAAGEVGGGDGALRWRGRSWGVVSQDPGHDARCRLRARRGQPAGPGPCRTRVRRHDQTGGRPVPGADPDPDRDSGTGRELAAADRQVLTRVVTGRRRG